MKKVVLVSALVAAMCTAKAQDGGSNAVKINPLSLFLATGNVAYERATGESQSFQLGLFYSGVKLSSLKYSGFGITPEYRFYFGGRAEAMNGVYAAPFLRYQNFKIEDTDTKDKVTFSSFGGGALIGWEKSWDSGFMLDLFAGPAYNSGTVKAEGTADEDNFNISGGIDGFGVRTGITLGFRF
ncbi:DUF3575 domain-containing protein [Niastella caeni]|uniref:DUF3575 domain-containing protein n=1 Tax=Niastella caeni TaxID=2569763 RepID=A0A4S8HP92_9BACT|nr:DUF3575 domain-containing protein [Niastella caeni]THU34812.1 DUF3575 domain-containing protein [Niastella caeni]